MALEQLPTLASRGPRARERGSEAGTAQAGKRRLLVPGESSRLARGVHCRKVATLHPSGPLWLRRSGRQKARRPQFCRHLPQGSFKVWGQLRAPHASQRGSPRTGQRSPRTPKAAGCVAPAASRVARHCCRAGGLPPAPPGARIPRGRKDAGTEVPTTAPAGSCRPIGRHARAVQGRRARRGGLVSPGAVVGVGPSPWPHEIARQNRPLGGGGLAPGALPLVAAGRPVRRPWPAPPAAGPLGAAAPRALPAYRQSPPPGLARRRAPKNDCSRTDLAIITVTPVRK